MSKEREDPEQVMQLTGWMRTLIIIVGIVSIIAAIIVLIYPGIAVRTITIALAIGLLVIGMDRLASGVSGIRYRSVAREKGVAP